LLQAFFTSITPSWFTYFLQIHFPLKLLCFTPAHWLIRHKCQGDPDPRVIRSVVPGHLVPDPLLRFCRFLKVILFTPPSRHHKILSPAGLGRPAWAHFGPVRGLLRPMLLPESSISPFCMWDLVVSFSSNWTKLLVSQDSTLF
jgi:hypothetical protein